MELFEQDNNWYELYNFDSKASYLGTDVVYIRLYIYLPL